MALAAQTLLFFFPISFLVRDNIEVGYFVNASTVFIIAMSLSLCIFIPKILLMHEANKEKMKHEEEDHENQKTEPPVSTSPGIMAVSLINVIDSHHSHHLNHSHQSSQKSSDGSSVSISKERKEKHVITLMVCLIMVFLKLLIPFLLT